MKLNKKIFLYVLLVGCIFFGIYGFVKSTYSVSVNDEIVFDYTLDVDADSKLIKSVEQGTIVSDLLNRISVDNSKYQVFIYDKESNNKLTDNVVVSGDKIVVKDINGNVFLVYDISVLGDVNGDGEITISDVNLLFQHYRGEITIDKNYYLKAGDVDFGIGDNYIYSETINLEKGDSYSLDNLNYLAFPSDKINITLADVAKLYQYVNEKLELDYYADENYLINSPVMWKSSNTDVVTVDSNGKLSAVEVGTAKITATSSGSEVFTHYVVIENNVINPVGISLNKTSIDLNYNETEQLTYTISPADATDKNITWKSSNSDVVTVDSNGKITAVGMGTAIITVATVNDISASCTVTVKGFDRIHFVSNGNAFEEIFIGDKSTQSEFQDDSGKYNDGPSPSEVILLESEGKFGLIDTGLSNSGDKSNDNINRAKYVIKYLNKIGVKELEFIIITHVHYDHMGGAYSIVNAIPTKKIYTKSYLGNDGSSTATIENNRTRFEKIKKLDIWEKINGANEGKKIALGNMDVTFLATTNLTYYEDCYGEDENINSIMNYITVNGRKIFLTGDVESTTEKCALKSSYQCNGTSLTECVLKNNPEIRNVDLFKLPHHGYSSCDVNDNIVNMLNPENILVFNWEKKVDYYYDGIKLSNGVKIGPKLGKYTACDDSYFSNHSPNEELYYVDNRNLIFDFTDGNMDVYTIE